LASKHRRIAVPKYFYIPVISVSEKKVSSLYLARVDTVGLIYKNGKRLKQNIPSLQSFVFGGTGASGSMFLSDHFYLMGRSMLKTYPWEFQFFNGLKIDRYTGMMSWEWYDAENKSVIEMLGECNKLSSFEDSNYDEVKEFVDDGMKFLANIVVDHYKALPKFEVIEKKKKF
jgi:hypothetical protein